MAKRRPASTPPKRHPEGSGKNAPSGHAVPRSPLMGGPVPAGLAATGHSVADSTPWTALQAELDRLRADLRRKEVRRMRPVRPMVDGAESNASTVWRVAGDPLPTPEVIKAWKRTVGWTRSAGTTTTALMGAIRSAWDERLASVSRVEGFRDGRLTVGLTNQALLSEATQFRLASLTESLRVVMKDMGISTPLRSIRFISVRKRQQG